MTTRALPLLLASLVGACAVPVETLQSYSSGPIGCSPDDIRISNQVRQSDGQLTWDARCRGRLFHCNAADCNPDVADAASPTVASGPPPTWGPRFVARHYRQLTPQLGRCLDATAPNEIVFVIEYDQSGRPKDGRFVTPLPEAQRSCIVNAIGQAPLSGYVRSPSTYVRVTLTPEDARARIVSTLPPRQAPVRPAATAGGEVPAPAPLADEATLRSTLDARSTAFLACNGGNPLAVRAAWDAEGEVTLNIDGASDEVIGCVRASAGPLLMAPGAGGSILHAVTPR
ncbi:MAG: hypothetical protein AAGH15_12760 [Myxococcota bacterium]